MVMVIAEKSSRNSNRKCNSKSKSEGISNSQFFLLIFNPYIIPQQPRKGGCYSSPNLP